MARNVGAVKSTQKGLPALDSDASYNCGFSKGKWPSVSHHDGAAFTLPSMASKNHAHMAWLTRTSCSRCPCGSTTFQENLTVSAASTPGSAVLFCWKPPTSAWAQVTGRSSSVPLNQGMGRYTQDLMITPRAMKTIGALLTIIDDYAPHNENYRGFID